MTKDVETLKGLVLRNPAILRLEEDEDEARNLIHYAIRYDVSKSPPSFDGPLCNCPAPRGISQCGRYPSSHRHGDLSPLAFRRPVHIERCHLACDSTFVSVARSG